MTLSEVNLARGRPANIDAEMETILELMEQGGASLVYHYMSLADVETIYRYPNAAVASDGGVQQMGVGKPHPRSYGTNARVLAEFVRELETMRLEDAIRRMTSLPARHVSAERSWSRPRRTRRRSRRDGFSERA